MWCNYFYESIYVKSISMKKDSKKLLFEMMEKVNPDFKMNEVMPPTQLQGNQTGDVANLRNAANKAPTMQYADSRIDTPDELQAAFGDWISRTGYSLNIKPIRPISISQVQTLVTNAMIKLGYK
jgi:hypothetical protein